MRLEKNYLNLFNDIKFKMAMHTIISIALLLWYFINGQIVLLQVAIIYYVITMSVFPLRLGGVIYTNKKLTLKKINKKLTFTIGRELMNDDDTRYYAYRIIGVIDDNTNGDFNYLADNNSAIIAVDVTTSKLKMRVKNTITSILILIYMTFY